jgi:hypothetical protein
MEVVAAKYFVLVGLCLASEGHQIKFNAAILLRGYFGQKVVNQKDLIKSIEEMLAVLAFSFWNLDFWLLASLSVYFTVI